MSYIIRDARPEDMPAVMAQIRELAEIEDSLHKVQSSTEELVKWIFADKPKVFCSVAEHEGSVIGYAIYFFNFSTYRGKPGIYIEDIYVKAEHRGAGIGKAFFSKLAAMADAKGLERLQWWAEHSNKAAIAFYEKMGAKPCSNYTVFQLDDDAMRAMI